VPTFSKNLSTVSQCLLFFSQYLRENDFYPRLMNAMAMLRQQSGDTARLRRTATLCTIDKPAEREQDCVHSLRLSVRQVCPLEVGHETYAYPGFDFMCVVRVDGMEPAANGQMLQRLEAVPPAQHGALEPL
jgi:hypothetical protein